ncbi:MAG: outer membrane protein transport protein [Nitrospinae bacterium]|nr:outer membrane protein transport protein [Nitrospinota bacterium]
MRITLSLLTAAVVLAFSAPAAMATNGHQMMGIGAYQKSMGGAVTAAPYDTTTAVANPAGIALIGTKADFNFDLFMPSRTADFTNMGGQSNQGGSPLYLVPAVGWVGPVDGRDDLFFGGGMFLVSGMGVDYDSINAGPFDAVLTQLAGGVPGAESMTMYKANMYSQYQFWKLAPSLAKKVNEQLTLGVALNVDYQQLAVKQKFYKPGTGSYLGMDLSRASGALGFGFTLGAVYKMNEMITLGATYTSEQSFADMEYRLSGGDVLWTPDATGNMAMNRDGTYKIGMNFPQQLAVGVAIAPSSALKITADVKWINFKSTHDKVNLKGTFDLINMMTGPTGQTASSVALPFGWDDVMVYALGLEFKATDMVTLRAGYNHGASPIQQEDVFNNLVFPAIVEDHIGLGADFTLGDHWGLGLAYMKAFKKSFEGKNDMTMLGQTISSASKIELEEQSLILALSYNFGK